MAGDKKLSKVSILLNKNNCYYKKQGVCSLDLIDDFSLSHSVINRPNHLLYCPNLLKMISKNETSKPLTVIMCDCGHEQVLTGHQRSCVSSKKGLDVFCVYQNDKSKEMCPVCGGQVTFYNEANSYVLIDLNLKQKD